MANLWQPSLQRITDANGDPVSTAQFEIYREGSLSIFEEYFLDPEGLTPGPNPLPSKGFGLFPAIYLDGSKTYRIRCVNTANGEIIIDVDNQSGLATETAIAADAADRAQASAEIASAASQVTQDLTTAELYSSVASFPEADGTNGFALILFGDEEGVYEDVQGDPNSSWVRQGDTQALRSESFSNLSRSWAEGTSPGGLGTKSAREHAQDSAVSASEASEAASLLLAALDGLTSNSPASSINANGWSAEVDIPSDLSFDTISVLSRGFNSSGVSTLHTRNIPLSKRVRLAWPNESTFTEQYVAVSEYIYSTDTIIGVTNNSTVSAPKPELRWIMPSRLRTDGTCHWEIGAGHRDAQLGSQVACVEVRGNDGINQTEWQRVSQTSLSSYVDGPVPVECFQGDLNTSALSGTYWLEARGYPWFGEAASIEDSENNEASGKGRRAFTRRFFSESDVPAFVYVSSTGDDSTGSANTNSSSAASTPCLTVGGAQKALHDLLGTGANALDGAVIYIVDGVSMGAVPFTGSYRQQGGAGVIITRAPTSTRAQALVTMSQNYAPDFDSPDTVVGEGSLVLHDISLIHQSGSFPGISTANLDVIFWNIAYTGNSVAGRNNSHFSLFGIDFSTGWGNNLLQSGGVNDRQVRIMRGVTIAEQANLEGYVQVGCDLVNPSINYTVAEKTGFCVGNKFRKLDQAIISYSVPNGDTIEGYIFNGNLIEFIGDGVGPVLQMSNAGGNTKHIVLHNNTFTGASATGRINFLYDGFANGGSLQTHELASFKGNILPQINYKGDVFNETVINVGYFPIMHGVGVAGNFIQFLPNAPSTESADFDGLGSISATQINVRLDPLFVDYQGSTNVGTNVTAGLGDGDYRLQPGSPARGILSTVLSSFDIAGESRSSGAQSAGCYA